ncbi:hypothetical protein SAMN02927916_2553 [Flavobacterium anhuiense]|uniref:Uncharacterized protein n=1 Tax=Flavobacterium anhuiense TaxID=459526 RepID=A0ABY0LUG5_9FLAO|nr:hypothetical protein [Flavobacterium anhuiense]SCY60647.1 hypothetical protein SAMN02927916_2553 [Flavobacterium anhuiense]
MNNYLKDSFVFFNEVSRRIEYTIPDNEIIQLAFNMALGCERLLKGILYEINPTYILIEPDFKHSLQTLYPDKILSTISGSKQLENKPNSDVITFNNSLLRTQLVSESTINHKNILFTISKARDIIAHCELNQLEKQSIKEIIQRDFYTMLLSFSKELQIDKRHFFDGKHIKLSKISASLQTDLNEKLKILIETHQEIWKSLSGNENFITQKEKSTQTILDSRHKDKIECPSCKNIAIIYLKPIVEFNQLRLLEETIGHEIIKLKCEFCKLEINESSILDKLGIRNRKLHRNSECIYCGIPLEEGETCNHCSSGSINIVLS